MPRRVKLWAVGFGPIRASLKAEDAGPERTGLRTKGVASRSDRSDAEIDGPCRVAEKTSGMVPGRMRLRDAINMLACKASGARGVGLDRVSPCKGSNALRNTESEAASGSSNLVVP